MAETLKIDRLGLLFVHKGFTRFILLLPVLLCCCSCARVDGPLNAMGQRNDSLSQANLAEPGDVAWVRYSITPADRTESMGATGKHVQEVRDILVGAVKEELDLGQLCQGMAVGEQKSVVLPPEKGFGPRQPGLVKRFVRVRRYPMKMRIPVAQLAGAYHAVPEPGALFRLSPYFMARVDAIDGDNALISCLFPKKEEKFPADFGTTTVRREREGSREFLLVQLQPRIGAEFTAGNRKGRITGFDDDYFTVDFNHPLSGRSIELTVQVQGIVKARELQHDKIDWMDDYGSAKELAGRQNKPLVLLLYSEDCPWCHRLKVETLHDPRILALKDRFVWAMICPEGQNDPRNDDLKKQFHLDGYPLTVVMGPDGRELVRIDGFREAPLFRDKLLQGLEL